MVVYRYQDARCTFMVTDTGPGLSTAQEVAEGDIPLVFQRFHQELLPDDLVDFEAADTLREKIAKGLANRCTNSLGIGLSLAYHLVQAVGGELRYSSIPGDTKFWFSLPAAAMKPPLDELGNPSRAPVEQLNTEVCVVREAHDPMALSGVSGASNTSGQIKRKPGDDVIETQVVQAPRKKKGSGEERFMTELRDSIKMIKKECVASQGLKAEMPPLILVVEDTDICAKLICMTLRKLNCATKRAENGQVAVDMLREAMPGMYSLILMDLRMPVMDGLDATRLIKQELKLDTPVVAVTGDSGPETQKICAEIGFDDFQNKPMKRNQLKAIVEKFTGHSVK
uniref:Response regulatory domain-containing protein n=1 Tax=Octactis speculum TaxID=3111310 RepID=A0A7S2GWN1_9STRA